LVFDGGEHLNKYTLGLQTIKSVSETLLSYMSVNVTFSLSAVFGWKHLHTTFFFHRVLPQTFAPIMLTLALRVISNFRLEVEEYCALLTASSGTLLPTFWDNLSVPPLTF
jgi:small basic protein